MSVDFNRQENLSLTIPEHVTVIGIGGVGTWLALFSAMSGVKEILLFDDDIIESHNLNRQFFKESQIGLNKAEAMKTIINEFRPEITVTAYPNQLNNVNKHFIPKNTVIYSAVDNQACRKIIAKIKAKQKMYLYAEEHSSTVALNEMDSGDWELGTGYTVIPQSVVPNVLSALLGLIPVLNVENLKETKKVKVLEINVLELFKKNS